MPGCPMILEGSAWPRRPLFLLFSFSFPCSFFRSHKAFIVYCVYKYVLPADFLYSLISRYPSFYLPYSVSVVYLFFSVFCFFPIYFFYYISFVYYGFPLLLVSFYYHCYFVYILFHVSLYFFIISFISVFLFIPLFHFIQFFFILLFFLCFFFLLCFFILLFIFVPFYDYTVFLETICSVLICLALHPGKKTVPLRQFGLR